MQIIVPNYYKEFRCIADKCQHSCCIGWEIDIDEDSLARFDALSGPYGDILRTRIDRSGETPHYRLSAGERCPFLQPNGLCEMILKLGEDALCQICADHPRFRNHFSHRVELGIGLCCEAAAALILKREAPMTLEVWEDDGIDGTPDGEEDALLSFRDMLLSILQDRTLPLDERFRELLDTCGTALPEGGPARWADTLLELERLDEAWTDRLNTLKTPVPAPPGQNITTALEQAAVYFLLRHLPAALEDSDVASKAAFAVFSAEILRSLCARIPNATLDDLVELARMYSSEIEYSEDNLWTLFDWLKQDFS